MTELNLNDLEHTFVKTLFSTLKSSGYDTNRIAINRKGKDILNFQLDGLYQFGRIKLNGRVTKMQIISGFGVTWYENETFDFYISQIPKWIKYINPLGK